jgi:hypothetical protein
MNWKGSAEQENKSCPPPHENTTTLQSTHNGGNHNNYFCTGLHKIVRSIKTSESACKFITSLKKYCYLEAGAKTR